ncbi:MAG: cytochrome P460 family protein [Oligoflexales bacterium]
MNSIILKIFILGILISSCGISNQMRIMREKIKRTDSEQTSNNEGNVVTGKTRNDTPNKGNASEKEEKEDTKPTPKNTQDSGNQQKKNDKPGTPENTESTGTDGLEDTSEQGIEDFLALNSFQNWILRQEQPIETSAPHGQFTQTFVNQTAEKSLRAGNQSMPVGSVIVKIMYQQDARTEFGRALMVKTSTSKGNSNWTWYEGFTNTSRRPFYGPGLALCVGCHSAGRDFVSQSLIKDLDL